MVRSLIVALAFGVLAACSSEDPAPSGSSSDAGTKKTGTGTGSFKEDVVPILAQQCALTACHGAKESNLGIHLTYVADQLYEELQKTSPTFNVKFVVPGDPENSFLMQKMDGNQGAKGTEMPPGEIISKDQRDIVRLWIKNGAKND